MRRRIVIAIAFLLLVVGAILIGRLARPTNDLAFLEQWYPIHETRVGDFAHPNELAYGTWTVLRFGSPYRPFQPDLSPEETRRWLKVPNLEDVFVARMPGLVVKPTQYVPDAAWVDTIKNPDGGADRYLWVASGMTMSPDSYQVWIKHESWWERTWAAFKHRLGF